MTIPGASQQILGTSAQLQEFLLAQPAGSLVLVPHLRLAHQLWRRQRLAAREQGLSAWEPLALTTLAGWWQQLGRQLWLTAQLASPWQRLLLWRRAMAETPLEAGVAIDLSWALLLDEAFDLWERYGLSSADPGAGESSLIAWRQAVFQRFAALLAEEGLLSQAGVVSSLLAALHQGVLDLPDRLVVVGLENPAPLEEEWLSAVCDLLPVLQVRLSRPSTYPARTTTVALPDRRQEMAWVAARVLELSQEEQIPLHRLAITAPNLEDYLPEWRRLWRELLGEAATEAGGRYNFSLGPTLAETPLFQAAWLPLHFLVDGEQRQDLIAWLQSPFYGVFTGHRQTIWQWDWLWREQGLDYGWPALGKVREGGEGKREKVDDNLPDLLDQAVSLLRAGPAPASVWLERLQAVWRQLGFPSGVTPQEKNQWQILTEMLRELARASGDRLWSGAALLEWLRWGAGRVDLPSDGSSEAGIQILGLLELRGLDFDAVFCLGLNMGVFPPPPRPLFLLSPREKAQVLGGDYQSQWEFARLSYAYLQAAAPALVLTRPLVEEEEDRLPSPVVAATWPETPEHFGVLSRPHPAWLRSPGVQAAFQSPGPQQAEFTEEPIMLPLPAVLSLSALEAALSCPCRFYGSVLLGLRPLPEVESGLAAAVRGEIIHRVLHRFTRRFGQVLAEQGCWEDGQAARMLEQAAAESGVSQDDPHWEAEVARWLAGEGGVLREWLHREKERYQAGWRWQAMEEAFSGLHLPGWPTSVTGRLDRLDQHPREGVMLWDYKTGEIPSAKELAENQSHFQLAGYLLAVQQGLTPSPAHLETRAGVIGLKSSRQKHLKYEDFKLTAADWQRLLQVKLEAVAARGERVGAGDFRPDPSLPPPAGKNSCRYCPYGLLCGYRPATQEVEEA